MLRKHDVSICFTTPPFISLQGWFLRCVKGTKMVYWVMDLYPDVPVACGVMKEGSLVTRFFESINRFCLRRADAVVALGRMRDRILANGLRRTKCKLWSLQKSIDPEKGIEVHIIGVWTDSEEVKPVPRSTNRYRHQRMGYWRPVVGDVLGNFGLGHDVDTFLGAK